MGDPLERRQLGHRHRGRPAAPRIYNPAEWHFAATADTAVAVGPAVETGDPTAMVSVAKTAP